MMAEPVHMQKPLNAYKAVIFDVDGTLYFQKRLRFLMACRLAGYYLRHPFRWKELLAVKTFRQARESWQSQESKESLDWQQYAWVGKKMGKPAGWVKETVERWMYQAPLSLLPGCQDMALTRLIKKLRRQGISVWIYSDYPAKEKLNAMGIEADGIFTALDDEIMCLKPDPKAMAYILSAGGLSPDEALMVGDRYEKDGLSARGAGVDWLILPSSPKKRARLLEGIINEE